MSIFLAVIGWICVIYFLSIAFFVGHGTNFFFVWLLLGVAACGYGFLLPNNMLREFVGVCKDMIFQI